MTIIHMTEDNRRRGRRGYQTGLTERIREVLRSGPMTAEQIAHRLRVSRATVQPLMRALSKASGIYRVGGDRRSGFIYSITPVAKPQSENPRIAGRITIGRGARWGAGI